MDRRDKLMCHGEEVLMYTRAALTDRAVPWACYAMER